MQSYEELLSHSNDPNIIILMSTKLQMIRIKLSVWYQRKDE